MVVLVSLTYIGEIGVDDKDCFKDQDWTYGTSLSWHCTRTCTFVVTLCDTLWMFGMYELGKYTSNTLGQNASFSLSSRQIHLIFRDPLIQADLAPSQDLREYSAADVCYIELYFAIPSVPLAPSLSRRCDLPFFRFSLWH